jgi:hypothetical protein
MRAPTSFFSGNGFPGRRAARVALGLATAAAIALPLLDCKGTAPTQMKEPQPATATGAPEGDAAPPDLAK